MPNSNNNIDNENELEIKNLSVEYRTQSGVVSAVNNLDITIKKGKTLALVGETGAGKTTTGLSIMRLISSPPGIITSGSVCVDGKNTLDMSVKELRQLRGDHVAMIFQDPMTSLNPVQSVEKQIAEAIREHNKKMSKKQVLAKAREMLELVGIPKERGVEYPHQFSGGMKQRVVIAIALSCKPSLLIADEPTTALDVTIQAQVMELMRDLQCKYKTSMLMITHDLGIVAEICDEVSIIYAGQIVEHGNLVDIYDNTKHPYTIGLFNSLPNMENRTAKLKPIKGLMPDPSNLPTGCPFHPRCDYATPICSQKMPPITNINETHYVKCHNFENTTLGKDGGLHE